MDEHGIPKIPDLVIPTLTALKTLGGSGHIDEILTTVVEMLDLTEDQQAVPRGPDTTQSLLEARLGWARNRLKNAGAIENSSQGVWSVTRAGRSMTDEQVVDAYRQWRKQYHQERRRRLVEAEASTIADEPDDFADGEDLLAGDWRGTLLEVLKKMAPDAFERLAQRVLREEGFHKVAVTGQTGDGGIDGVGVLRVSLVSFPIFFQCKRYAGSVGASAVRDFRGAMAGRGEKGLLITTGTFTRGAQEEATRDGAPPVELIDGRELCDLLRKHELGVDITERVIEDVTVRPEFFDGL